MKLFDDMKVSLKLGVLILIALLSSGVIGYTGYYYLQQSSTEMSTMYAERLIPVKLFNENRSYIHRVNAAILELMLTTDGARDQELKQIIDNDAAAFNSNLAEIEKHPLDSQAKELLNQMKSSLQKYREARAPVIELAIQNKNVEAYAMYTKNVEALATEVINNLRNLSDYYSKISEQMNVDNKAAVEKATQITIAILLLSFVILGLSGFYITKIITTPLKTMVVLAKDLSNGDFRDKPRKFVRKDEIGQLADALVGMRDSLRTLMKHVNESSEQLAASSEQLTASADQSAQAANQIAESITEVATSAEQQLGVTNDALTVVDQMSDNIKQVAANASQVAEQSAQSAVKANEGNKSIDKAVNQMAIIEQTVTTSAQVVVKLGER